MDTVPDHKLASGGNRLSSFRLSLLKPTPKQLSNLSSSVEVIQALKMTSGFDDEELSMSLSSSGQDRRSQRPAPPRPNYAASPHGQVTQRAPTDKRTQQRIGLYDVKKTLGEGSFGKVKLATHQVTKQEVALKIISRKKLISRDMAGRVEREIQYLQLLRHPHIIKLYEAFLLI